MTVAPGTELLGKYEILEPVSETRYLEIYAAKHLILARPVQVVLLREDVAARPGVADRMLELGRVLANHREPQLLDIYEPIEIPGRVGVVTEVPPTEGRTLAEAMAVSTEVWSANRIRKQLVPCIRALARLHHYDLIHGSLAPRSFIRDSQNELRLTDLAHIRLESPRLTSRVPPPLDDVRYIAPEWFADFDEVQTSADIYSMGCILYELATGRPPFQLEDPRDMMSAHLAERPPEPREVRPGIPDGMERIILRALSKHPLYRFESTDAMADALESFERYLAPIPVGAAPWERDDTEPDDSVTGEDESASSGEESDSRAEESASRAKELVVDDDPEPEPDSRDTAPDPEDLVGEMTVQEDADTLKEAIDAVNAVADANPLAELSSSPDADLVTEKIPLPGASSKPPSEHTTSDDEEGGDADADEPDADAEEPDADAEEPDADGPPGADGTVLRKPREQVVMLQTETGSRSADQVEDQPREDDSPDEEDDPGEDDDPAQKARERANETTVPRSREDIPVSQRVLVGEPSPVLAKRRRRRLLVAAILLLVGAGGAVAWYFLRPGLGRDAVVTVDRNYEDVETLMLFEPGENMEVIPAGPVLVGGRPHPELWEGNQLPLRSVSLASFAIDRTEVSAGDYRRCVEAGACSEPGYPDRPLDLEPEEPVRGVSWGDAAAYCAFAEKRLPTEAEWEAAARGRTNRFFPWGDDFQCRRANVNASECQLPEAGPQPVAGGEIGESPWGVTRMAGNVWEWTADDYVEPEWLDTARQEGEAPPEGRGKVIKGGDWDSPPRAIGWRAWNPPDIRDPQGGFRCARTVADGINLASDNVLGGTGTPNHRLSGYLMGGEYHPLTERPLDQARARNEGQ